VTPVRRAWAVLRQHGPFALLERVGRRIAAPRAALPVRYEDARDTDWRAPHPAVAHPLVVRDRPLVVAWILPPPGASSGGHQTIFRFVAALEEAGHRVRLYYDSASAAIDPPAIHRLLEASSSYPRIAAEGVAYRADGRVAGDVDAIVATSWETAYTSFRDPSPARRLYFVQDYEPDFSPVGSASVLAANTYRFGFTGITAGGWLAERLGREFGMDAIPFDFGVDTDVYRRRETRRRGDVFFYARPQTERRGFELGTMALDLVARRRPEIGIHLAGWDVRRWKLPFPYTDHGVVGLAALDALYNRCAAGLVVSLTNMSLMPLELLASGTIPVVTDGPNNRLVSGNPYIDYAPALPVALADRLIAAVDRADQAEHSAAAAASVQHDDWSVSARGVVAELERRMRG
jgi:O-antigen biosynthesis protein